MASPAPFLSKLWNQHALPLPTPHAQLEARQQYSPFSKQLQGRGALIPAFHHPGCVKCCQEAPGTTCAHGPKWLEKKTCKIPVGSHASHPTPQAAIPFSPALSVCPACGRHGRECGSTEQPPRI